MGAARCAALNLGIYRQAFQRNAPTDPWFIGAHRNRARRVLDDRTPAGKMIVGEGRNLSARETYLRDVYPRLAPPVSERYPLVSLLPQAGRKPLGQHRLLMVVALTGTGKSTALDIVSRRLGGRGFGLIPTRREVADWIAIPLAQHWSGEVLAPAPDRVKRFAYTRRFAERVEGGMAAAFSWLNLADDYDGALLSEGIRGGNELRFALRRFPDWRIVELALHPLTRLRRLSGRNEAFDRAAGRADLSFLPLELRDEAAALLRAGEISERALAITRAEAANYGLQPFADGDAYRNYQRLDIDGCAPEQVADRIIEILQRPE